MTLYQQEMLRKLGRLDCAGRYDEEKGLLVISSGGTGLCCQDKKGYLSWESEKIRTEEEKAVLSQIGEQAKLIRAYVGQYEFTAGPSKTLSTKMNWNLGRSAMTRTAPVPELWKKRWMRRKRAAA